MIWMIQANLRSIHLSTLWLLDDWDCGWVNPWYFSLTIPMDLLSTTIRLETALLSVLSSLSKSRLHSQRESTLLGTHLPLHLLASGHSLSIFKHPSLPHKLTLVADSTSLTTSSTTSLSSMAFLSFHSHAGIKKVTLLPNYLDLLPSSRLIRWVQANLSQSTTLRYLCSILLFLLISEAPKILLFSELSQSLLSRLMGSSSTSTETSLSRKDLAILFSCGASSLDSIFSIWLIHSLLYRVASFSPQMLPWFRFQGLTHYLLTK